MLINASHPEENRVAIVVDGLLHELDIELAGQEHSKGNIYKAVVVRVETGLQAAFVDYGAEKLGFLQIGEIHPSLYPASDGAKKRPRIADILKRGQEILVQVVKEERGTKGAALTTYLSLPGRYMVLMPDSDTKGVSRKINEESERRKLKKTMNALELPEQMGYIVRTAGIGKDKEELKRDFDYLVRLYEGILDRKDQIKAPAQLYQESSLAIRSIRDYFSAEMDEVLIDDQQVYEEAKDFFALVMPEQKRLVKRHRERRPIFSRYQIEEQIEGLSKNQIPLASGGSIVIDQTEALVAIDVNSGKMSSESGIEATALKTNLEAAAETGRQLRLRDLGGLIVIDFIDMRERKHIRETEQELRKAFKDDKARVSLGRISQFGLMEMSRQRLKPTLSVGAFQECPHCTGTGKIPTIEAQAVSFLRQAHTAAARGQIGQIEAVVPLEVANYLLNQKRDTIIQLERQLNLRMSILGREGLLPGTLELEAHKREKEPDESRQIMPVSHANQIEIALAAAQETEQESAAQTPAENAPDKTAESAEASPQEADPTPAKKRRRRRRKKPSAQTVAGQETETAPVSQATTQEEHPAAQEEAETTTTASSAQQESAEGTAQQQESNAPTSADAVGPDAEQPEPPVRSSKRPRRPRKTAAAPSTDGPQESANDAGEAPPEKKSPRRRTRKTQETSPVPAVNQPAETDSDAIPETSRRTAGKAGDDKPADTEQPRPARRTRKSSSSARSAAKADQPSPPAGENASQETTESAADARPRRRTSAKKTAGKDSQAASSSSPAEQTAPDNQKSSPQPAKRTSRTRAKSKPAAGTAAAERDAPAKNAAEKEDPQPTPRKSRTPRKTPARRTAASGEAVSTNAPQQADPEKTTTRSKSSRTGKAAGKESAEALQQNNASNTGQKASKTGGARRGSRKKTMAEATATEAGATADSSEDR